MLQVAIAKGMLDFKIAVVAKKFIAGRDVDVISVEGDSAQTSIRTPAFEVDIAGIPVNVLFAGLRFEVDRIDTAVAFALLAASDDGRRNEFG